VVYVSFYERKGKVTRQMIDDSLNLKKARIVTACAYAEDSDGIHELKFARDYLNGCGFRTNHFTFSPYAFLLGHNDLRIFAPEKRSARSPGSEAIYLGESRDRKDGLLLQFLPPNSHTSKHYHSSDDRSPKIETFHGMEGEGRIEVDGQDNLVREGTAITVFPNSLHQLRTLDYPALVLLLIEGDEKGISMDNHHYVD
jgi:mannose-6-phosphate isomerase-like protein (cupin superfamily)